MRLRALIYFSISVRSVVATMMSALSPGAPTSNNVADMCPTGRWIHLNVASTIKITCDGSVGSVKLLRARGK